MIPRRFLRSQKKSEGFAEPSSTLQKLEHIGLCACQETRAWEGVAGKDLVWTSIQEKGKMKESKLSLNHDPKTA